MGLSNELNSAMIGAASAAPYEIEQSLRFDGSAYLQRTVGSAPTDGKKYTISLWVKRGKIDANYRAMLGSKDSGGVNGIQFRFDNDETIDWSDYTSFTVYQINTSQVFRDPSAWYHMFITYDSTDGTAADRARMYINNERVTAIAFSTNPGLNAINNWTDNGATQAIGRPGNLAVTYFDGYIAEVHSVDGQGLEPTDFGKYNNDGVWVPKKYSGSYGTNGFYLKFDPSATNGIGHDHSGNGNNFTPSGFSTSGTGTDVMSDTPTNNFATLITINPNYGYQTTTPVDGNLKATFYPVLSPSHNPGAPALTNFKIPTTGKWYYEFTVSGSNNYSWGVAARNDGQELYNFTLSNRAFWGRYAYNGGGSYQGNGSSVYGGASGTASGGGSLSSGNVIGMALDFTNNSLTITKNGASYATFTNCNFTSYDYVLPQWGTATNGISGSAILLNAGQRAFEYTVPTDHQSLCTANLPAPDIADPSQYFDTVLDTGANILSSAQSTFSSGLWWIKDRANSNQNQFVDSVRGNQAWTAPSDVAQSTYSAPSGNSVAWCWSAPDTWSNSAGSNGADTASSGYRNLARGFSIARFSGKRPTQSVFAHGLTTKPEFILTRDIDNQRGCVAYHVHNGTYYVEYFDGYFGGYSSGDYRNVTSSIIDMGNTSTGNEVGTNNMMCYSWAPIPGYSAFGSYTGNGSSNGAFVHTGFRVGWVVIKGRNTSGGVFGYDWNVIDVRRDTYNPSWQALWSNQTYSEGSGASSSKAIDVLSNGFKCRTSDKQFNENGRIYLYAAFAEHPFGGDGVSPATAR